MFKRTVPLLITFLAGMTLLVTFFVPGFGNISDLYTNFFNILAAIAFILGGGNLLLGHSTKVMKRRSGWMYSLIAVVSFLTMLSFGLGKFGVPSPPGRYWTNPPMEASGSAAVGMASFNWNKIDGGRSLTVVVQGAALETSFPVSLAGRPVGTLSTNDEGRGTFHLRYDPSVEESSPASALRDIDPDADPKVAVGSLMSGTIEPQSRIMGEYNANGAAFWFLYQYAFVPLQQTTFAMLAFYVASAAFRAFRARNLESTLLLGTAFVILLGRTYLGTAMTSWLPDELSLLHIPNLTSWIMVVFNTAGNRAIMIGIALGVASTSLKVLLGVDRSYLGRE